MRERRPNKLTTAVALGFPTPAANSLSNNILQLSSYGSRFYPVAAGSKLANSLKTDILEPKI